MSARILDGHAIAESIKQEVARDVEELRRQGLEPGLAVVLAGNHAASELYVRNKVRACELLGIRSEKFALPATVSTEELLELVARLNARDDVDGILVQLPLPEQVDAKRLLLAIAPDKDVDGFHPVNVGNLVTQRPGLTPCTPAGILEILKRSGISLSGARAVVLGRSDLVGKPTAMLLLHEHATVTLCHSRTRNLAAVAREADILVAALGRPALVKAEFIKPGATVIDVGINKVSDPAEVERLFPGNTRRQEEVAARGFTWVGDVHFDSVREVAGALTPVPGGVGPLTIAMLMLNAVKACRLRGAGRAMLKVALTGGLACGKSSVAAVLREKGCEVVDADELGHRVLEPGGPAYQAVLEAFGRDLVDGQGRIVRSRLAERVFGRPEDVARLNSIVHPPIMDLVEERCREFARRNPRGILVVDAALVFEAGVERHFQKIIVVDCTAEQQVERFMAKGLGSQEEALGRIAAQLPRQEKLRRADFVIDASGTLEETRRQAEAIFKELDKLA